MGSKPVGVECLKFLLTNKELLNIQIVGVFYNPKRKYIPKGVFELSNAYNIKAYDNLDDILSLHSIDYIISVQYHKILKKDHIKMAKRMAINLHMAPLPEYRGCNQFSYAIINGDQMFGTTLHILNERIDDGDILCEDRFEIPKNCYVNDLVELTTQKSIELFKQNIGRILEGNIKPIPQSSLIKERGTSLHYRKEINDLKKIDLRWDKDKIHRYIRATSMPGFEPPFAMLNGEKIFLGPNSSINTPSIYDSGIKDVDFGKNVTLVKPVNLYGCKIGDESFIGPFTEIQKNVRIGKKTKIQSHSFICELVTIGDNCFIGHSVVFINDTFKDGAPAQGNKEKWRQTIIGDRVSIGSNATILPVFICDDVVIGAGSVVTKDILEPGTYAGNPAKRIHKD